MLTGLEQASAPQNPPPYQPVKETQQASPLLYQGMLLPDEVNLSIWQGLRDEMPAIPTEESFFRKTWGAITDVVGKPLDKVGDALTWPSDRLEQIAGLAYWNDVPDISTRWKLAQMTWEMTGFGKGALRDEAIRIANSGDDAALDKFIEENEGGISQLVMSFVADPLNVFGVGGLGYAAKGAKALKAPQQVVRAMEGLNRGLAISDLGKLGIKYPAGLREASPRLYNFARALDVGGNKVADRLQEQLADVAYRTVANGEFDQFARGRRLRPDGKLRNLFSLTPSSIAINVLSTGTMGLAQMAREAPSHMEATRVLNAVLGADYTTLAQINPAFVNNRELREFVEAVSQEAAAGVAKGTFDPAKMISMAADWQTEDGIHTLLGKKAYTIDQVRAKMLDPNFDPQKLWTDRMFSDLQDTMTRGTAHWVGIGGKVVEGPDGKLFFMEDATEAGIAAGKDGVDKFYSAYKKWLAAFYLNRPGFVFLNFVNNAFTGMFDGFGMRKYVYDNDLLEAGLDPGFRRMTMDKGSLADAIGVHTKHDVLVPKNIREVVFGPKGDSTIKTWTPFVQMASNVDQGFRTNIAFTQHSRITDTMWNFRRDGDQVLQGVLPQLPPGVSDEAATRFTDALIATRGQKKKLDELEQGLNTGSVGVGFEAFWARAVEEMGYRGEAATLMKDAFPVGLRNRFDELLLETGSGPEASRRLRGEVTGEHIKWNNPDVTALFPADSGRKPNLLQERHRMVATIRREREDLGEAWMRYMAWNYHSPAAKKEMESALVTMARREEAAHKNLFDVLDAHKITEKQRAAAVAAFRKERAAYRKDLRTATESILSRNPADTGWRTRLARIFELEDTASGALGQKLGDTLTAARAAGIVAPTADDFKKAAGELRHMTNRVNKLEREGADVAALAAAESQKMAAQEALDALRAQANAAGSGADDVDAIWREYHAARDAVWGDTTSLQIAELGIERRMIPRPRPVSEPGIPPVEEASQHLFDFRDDVLSRIERMTDIPVRAPVTPQEAALMRQYLRSVQPLAAEMRHVAIQGGKQAADWALLNYHNKRGFDEALKFVFPYLFWPSRTMHRWAIRTLGAPASTAFFAKALEAQDGMDIPERLKGKVRLPFPGMPEWMGGAMYFDPISMLFPYSHQFREDGFEDEDAPIWKKVATSLSNVGVALSPFATIPLAFTYPGAGGRTEYINYQMNGMPWLIPGTNAQRAITHFLSGGSPENWQDELAPEDIETLSLGQAFPEPQIRRMLGLSEGDYYDYYRVLRMIANMAGTGEITADQGLRAMKNRSGEVWERAKDMAGTERGLAALSSWAFGMAGTIYPKGEEIQRGLKKIFDVARESDRKSKNKDDGAVRAFFEAFPEYQVRQASQAFYRGRPAVDGEVDTALYYIDLAQVQDEFDSQIEYYKQLVPVAPKTYKPILSALYDEREKAMAKLESTYAKREKTPSYYMAPSERALYLLREQYYDLSAEEYVQLQGKRQMFVSKLTGQGIGASYYTLAQEADRIIDETSARIAADPGAQEKLYKQRDAQIESLTQKALRDISAADFVAFLETSKRDASDRQKQDMQLRDGLRTLFRTSRERWPELFEKTPGLTAKYGTNPDPVTTGLLDGLWLQYYGLTPNGQERQDWIYVKHPEINQLRQTLGLGPIQPNGIIRDPRQPYATIDPVAAAIARSQMMAEGAAP